MGDWSRRYNGDGYECWAGKGVYYGKKQGMIRDFCGTEQWCWSYISGGFSAVCVQWIKEGKKALKDSYLLQFNKYLL